MAFPPVPFQEWFLRQTSTGNAALNAYVARVKADGGIVEAIGCVPQAVWDWTAPAAPTLLLDLFPNAAAAYSLRKLRAAYSGAAVRVRESGGNTEADIGFTSAGELDTSALLAHCGANDGFVTVWYDQSLSNDATQTTANNQPKIVSAGSLVTENGKAAIDFDGVDDEFIVSDVSARSFYAVLSNVNGGDFVSTTQNRVIFDASQFDWQEKNFSTSISYTLGNQALLTFNDTTSGIFSLNGVTHTNTDANPYNQGSEVFNRIGANDAGSNLMEGTIQELILFDSDQSANRTAIETNINNFYSIY